VNTVKIRAANEKDNFIKIADCIYDTDPFIYPTAFGEDKKSAVQAIAKLIGIRESLLSYRNILIAVLDEKICGVLLYNEHGAEWNTEQYYSHIQEHVPNKEKFEYASAHYFIEEARPPKHNHIKVVALCVAPSNRRMGIAKALLASLLKEKRNSIIELDVLADNESAIRLYARCGFSVTNEFKGFSFTEETRPNCYHMVRM